MLFEAGFTYPSTLLGITSDNLRARCSISIPIATLLSNKLQKHQDEHSRDGIAKRYAETDWKQQQKREKTRIMHLRPPGYSYLPVYIMHEAFDEMAHIINDKKTLKLKISPSWMRSCRKWEKTSRLKINAAMRSTKSSTKHFY